MSGRAETFDDAAQNRGRRAQLRGGDELARAVGDADVAGAEDDGVRPELRHLRRFRAESDGPRRAARLLLQSAQDRKSTRLNSSHGYISYAVFCLKKKTDSDPSHG